MSTRSSALVLLIPFGVLACASSATHAVTDAELVRTSDARASLGDIEAALALADLGPLAVPVATLAGEARTSRSEYWQASAVAWNPELRQMRRRVRELRALRGAAGRPGAVEVEAETAELEDTGMESELALTIDVLGVLGLGPSRAARELAAAAERAALADLERALWRVRFDVDRARVRVAAAQALDLAMQALLDHVTPDRARLEFLHDKGWLPRAPYESAYASLHMAEHRQGMARLELTRARGELAALCGLRVDHPALAEVGSHALDSLRPDELEFADPTPEALLGALPELRQRRLELAVAEAELRSEAREAWPSLRLGPKLTWMPGEQQVGGMLGIELPFPGALDGRIAAAHERREAQREALEDAFVAARSRLATTQNALDQALIQLTEHSPDVDASVARMFIATQAEFRVDPMQLERWALALRERIESLSALVAARAEAAVAWLDYQEARGVAREVQP
jgi:outer membrane protein TolC